MSVYVGMDVHRKRSQIAIVDQAGDQQRNRNVPNDPTKLVRPARRPGAGSAKRRNGPTLASQPNPT